MREVSAQDARALVLLRVVDEDLAVRIVAARLRATGVDVEPGG